VVIGFTGAVLCEAQLFGLSLFAFHWYIGFDVRESPRNKLEHLLSSLKWPSLFIVPLLLLWAMWKFVHLSANTP
jgi:hypothetical protein